MTIVLIADDEKPARHAMKKALAKLDCTVVETEDGEQTLSTILKRTPDLVFLDLNMPGLDGIQILSELAARNNTVLTETEIVVVSANDTLASAVQCIQLGASDYLTKPYEVERIRAIAQRNIKRVDTECQLNALRHQLDRETAFGALIGVSRTMRELFDKLSRAANAPLDILIRGETGTGKELIARELHRLSTRHDGPFIAINTAAINESLIESELFGHVKGAFTGADKSRQGAFVLADGGTLFLDEIGDMPLPLQSKILRVLQEREVQAVGESRVQKIDVRIISATHQNLEDAIAENQFREDLYYRLKGIDLFVPPLRQRQEDIVLLAEYFLQQLAAQSPPQRETKRMSDAAIRSLLDYHWPGNVRELQQCITAAGAMAAGAEINPGDLALSTGRSDQSMPDLEGLPLSEAKNQLVIWFERNTIEKALLASQGNISAAARRLGMHRQSLQQKMTQLGIKRL